MEFFTRGARRIDSACSLLTLGAATAALLLTASPAMANGPCGADTTGPAACGVTSPSTESGTLVTSNESDYYVFHAQNQTELSVSVTDTENPICSTDQSPDDCGSANVELYDSQGDDQSEGASSNPENGITVPGTFDYSLGAGTYYLVVTGSLGSDQYGNPTALPYALSVNASPGVVWPFIPPPPACVVPRLTGKTASRARSALTAAHCAPGRISRRRTTRRHRGKVLSQSMTAGAHEPNAFKVSFTVGRG